MFFAGAHVRGSMSETASGCESCMSPYSDGRGVIVSESIHDNCGDVKGLSPPWESSEEDTPDASAFLLFWLVVAVVDSRSFIMAGTGSGMGGVAGCGRDGPLSFWSKARTFSVGFSCSTSALQ